MAAFQEREETRLSNGNGIALDDSLVKHNHPGKCLSSTCCLTTVVIAMIKNRQIIKLKVVESASAQPLLFIRIYSDEVDENIISSGDSIHRPCNSSRIRSP